MEASESVSKIGGVVGTLSGASTRDLRKQAVREAMSKVRLTQKEREALDCLMEGRKLADLARTEGVADGTVRARLARAVGKVRAEIPDFEVPSEEAP